jgi:hypothetical protein
MIVSICELSTQRNSSQISCFENSCEYYLDYYNESISKINHQFEFLAIYYNCQLLENFIYSYCKVKIVIKR